MTVHGLHVQVVRKEIKNLHLGVYPPNGRVRVAVPHRVSDAAVRLAVVSKLGWIRRQQARFEAQPRQSAREMVTGESHYYLGRRYRLRIIEDAGRTMHVVRGVSALDLHVRPGTSTEQRELLLLGWYRSELKRFVPPLLEKWQAKLGVRVHEWGIKRMKTRWGSCNPKAHRIWLNLELAKKPERCLEYLVLHELVHLIERRHSDRFIDIMNDWMPHWRQHRSELNAEPLAHQNWNY
jgi:predicted metal-dependent hydrolase